MAFFMDSEIPSADKIMEVFYILMGLMSVYAGVHNLRDRSNPSRYGTFVFWTLLGVVIAFGRWIPAAIDGLLIVIMVIPAIAQRVKPGKAAEPTDAEVEGNFRRIGQKVFIPALAIGVFAMCRIKKFTWKQIRAVYDYPSVKTSRTQQRRVQNLRAVGGCQAAMGPLCMLPMLLASLGAIFDAAGVGDVIARIVGGVIPAGNLTVGIIVFALGMMLFTMIMGNAFAAITVMTVGIGAPFVLSLGADPAVVGILALTCGYCGTLLTPMAANFNIVPVAMLQMKDRMGVIKNQVLPAFVMIVVQIIYMLVAC